MKMRILFLTDHFPLEVNASVSRTDEHCREWVKMGADVTVVTCFPNFPQGKEDPKYKNKLYQKEVRDGIKVVRVRSLIGTEAGRVRRTLDFIGYIISSFIAGLFIKADIIISTSPQFSTALSGRKLSFWKRKPWMMEVRELWPESIMSADDQKDSLFIRYMKWQEKRCYKSAKRIVVMDDSFKRRLMALGLDGDKTEVVRNERKMMECIKQCLSPTPLMWVYN